MERREENLRVVDGAGVGGLVVADPRAGEPLRVRLDDGSIVSLDEHLLQRRSDGTRELPGRWTELATNVSVPRVEEHVEIGKKEVQRGTVVVKKRVTEEDVTIDEPLTEEDIEVERVEVDRFVDTPPAIRMEGDTMIISSVEEVVVVERKLRVREELHVRRVRRPARHPVTVTVRREKIDVERRPPSDETQNTESNNQEEESS